MMHGRGKSDSAIVALKPANKAERSAAELGERRAGTKGNADQQSTGRAQNRATVTQALERIRQTARQRKRNGSQRSSTISASPFCGRRSSPSSETPPQGQTGRYGRTMRQTMARTLSSGSRTARPGPTGSVPATAVAAGLHTQTGPTRPGRSGDRSPGRAP
jgi:hypothetical protein